jgi:hypothetical protein
VYYKITRSEKKKRKLHLFDESEVKNEKPRNMVVDDLREGRIMLEELSCKSADHCNKGKNNWQTK